MTDARTRTRCADCGARIIVTRFLTEACDHCMGIVGDLASRVHELRMAGRLAQSAKGRAA